MDKENIEIDTVKCHMHGRIIFLDIHRTIKYPVKTRVSINIQFKYRKSINHIQKCLLKLLKYVIVLIEHV